MDHEARPAAARPLLAAALGFAAATTATATTSMHAGIATAWLVTAVLAIAVLLFASGPRGPVGWLPILAAALYAAAGPAAAGWQQAVVAVTLAGFLAGLAPAVRRARPLTVPQVAVLAAVMLLATGPLVDDARSPSLAAAAILAGTAAAEWRLRPGRTAASDTWGVAQLLLFVVGWAALAAGTAADRLDLLVSGAVLHGAGVALVLARLGPRLTRGWASGAVVCMAAYAGLLGHLVVGVAGGRYLERAAVPDWLALAMDHVVLGGVLGAGLLAAARPGRRRAPERAERQWFASGRPP